MEASIKKLIISVACSLFFVTGCQVNKDFSSENARLKSNLKPLNEHFKSYIFKTCDKDLTIHNYKSVLDARESGLYRSALSGQCVHISFNQYEPESFYSDMYAQSTDKEAVDLIIDDLTSQTRWDKAKERNPNFQGMDYMLMHNVIVTGGRFAQFVKFVKGDADSKLQKLLSNKKGLASMYVEYFFLHEIFHGHDMNYDRSIPQSIRESMSDVSAVIAISSSYALDIDKTIALARDVRSGRRLESKGNKRMGYSYSSTHYNQQMLGDMVEYFENIKQKGAPLPVVSSLADANGLAMEISLKLDQYRRLAFGAKYFWEPGMVLVEPEPLLVKELVDF